MPRKPTAPASSASSAPVSPEVALQTFIAKFAPPHQRLIRELRGALRRRYPAAHELVWDNYTRPCSCHTEGVNVWPPSWRAFGPRYERTPIHCR